VSRDRRDPLAPRMATTVTAIYRYPVKGLSAEKMDRVALTPGECLPHDRRFAIALGSTRFDPQHPEWLSKIHFIMLMRDEKLAQYFFAVRAEKDGTMQTRNRGDYTIAGHELVAEGADLRVQVLTLAAGQCVPWHYHTEISDSFVCLEGPMVVETRAPRHVYRLLPGERCAVPPKTAHYVHGEADGACKFLIVQGVGVYDFVAVGG
jgi:quercetin dioxygenase-like cupin family protein